MGVRRLGCGQRLNNLAELDARQLGASALVTMSLEQQAALPEGTGVRLKEVSRRGSWLHRAKLRHALHHHSQYPCNFGVTAGPWDIAFGSTRQSA